MAANALVVHQPAALTIHRDADVYHIAALILSTLDRLGMHDQVFSRIVVYSQRVIVFDLPWLTDAQATQLVRQSQPGVRLTRRIAPRIIVVRGRAQGCTLIIDLYPQITSGDPL